jgi:acyl carrier protein
MSMTDDEIMERLTDVFNGVFKENISLTETTSAKDIHSWDSLNHIILIKKIEQEFDFEFDLFDVIEIKNVGDIVSHIQNKVKK